MYRDEREASVAHYRAVRTKPIPSHITEVRAHRQAAGVEQLTLADLDDDLQRLKRGRVDNERPQWVIVWVTAKILEGEAVRTVPGKFFLVD